MRLFDHLIERRQGTLINPQKDPIKANNDENEGSGDEDDSIEPPLPSPYVEGSVNHNR